jgi:hypothetical protein
LATLHIITAAAAVLWCQLLKLYQHRRSFIHIPGTIPGDDSLTAPQTDTATVINNTRTCQPGHLAQPPAEKAERKSRKSRKSTTTPDYKEAEATQGISTHHKIKEHGLLLPSQHNSQNLLR